MVEKLVLTLAFVGVDRDVPPTAFKYDGGAPRERTERRDARGSAC